MHVSGDVLFHVNLLVRFPQPFNLHGKNWLAGRDMKSHILARLDAQLTSVTLHKWSRRLNLLRANSRAGGATPEKCREEKQQQSLARSRMISHDNQSITNRVE